MLSLPKKIHRRVPLELDKYSKHENEEHAQIIVIWDVMITGHVGVPGWGVPSVYMCAPKETKVAR
jgi:hypothetical protein